VARRIEIGDVEIAYEDTGGDGPAVVLVHGLGGSAYAWWAQLGALRDAGYRAIAPDQRGAGRSARVPGPYSVEGWAEDVERLLDGLGIERAALVGHSVGCMIAEHAAVRLGERATALALCGGAARWPEAYQPGFEERAQLARAGRMDANAEAVAERGLTERCRSERPEIHGLLISLVASNDPDSYAEWALATGAGSMRDLDRVACRVLAFAGDEDAVTPLALAEEIADVAPRGETATIPEAAHWCMLEQPQAVNEALVGFLDRAVAT
jgi:pimeloyl-ACP methyl ester carboxylesterase